MIDRPTPLEPAFGEVEIEAVVVGSEPVEMVSFYVDGVFVGEVSEPPFNLRVDLGEDVGSHRFQAVATGLSGLTAERSVTTPPLRVDGQVSVSLQSLYVTVSRDGHRVLDLAPGDFEIRDRGVPQELVTFARGDVPFTAVVLVDSSESMRGGKLESALRGARAFFSGMQPLDLGKLVVFADRIAHTTPFSSFPEVLTAGLGGVTAGGGTAVHDNLYLALKQLEERRGRRVVVLLSDGVDSHSVLSMEDVLDSAGFSQALIYWLRLPYGGDDPYRLPDLTTSWRDPAGHQRQFDLLHRTIEHSGGRIELLESVDRVEEAFRRILTELREQYVLGYYPGAAQRDGTWHEVRVRVPDRGVDVRCQRGYLDF